MEGLGSLLLLIGVLAVVFMFFTGVARLILRIFGPVGGSLILLFLTFGLFGGDDDC